MDVDLQAPLQTRSIHPGPVRENGLVYDNTMNHILVTGANGFVGRALCRQLLAEGQAVRGAVRTDAPQPGMSPGMAFVTVGDVNQSTEWTDALAGRDVVVHLAARVHVMVEKASDPLAVFREVNVSGTERLARQAAASHVRRFVFISTLKVHGETSANPLTEDDEALPGDSYSVSKWEAELALRRVAAETGMEVVVIRPPLVYGPQVRANFLYLLKLVDSGIPLPFGAVRNRRSFIYLGNLVDAVTVAASHPRASGQSFLVSDGHDVSTGQLITDIASAMGKPLRLWSVPTGFLRFFGKLCGRQDEVARLTGSLTVDCSGIKDRLGWRPPYSMMHGLEDTIRWYRSLGSVRE